MSKQPELVDGFLKKKLDESWKLLQPTQNSGVIIYGKDRDLERQDTLRAEEWQELIPMIKHPLETEVGEVFFGQQNTIKVQGHVVEAKSGCKIKPGIYSLEENDGSRQKFGYKGSTADYRLNNTALLNWYKDDANFSKLVELNPVTKTDWMEFGQGPYASKGVRLRNLEFDTGFYQYVKRYIPLEKDSGVIFDVSGGCHVVGTVAYLDENGLVSPYDKAKKKTWRLKTGLSNIFQPEFDFRESDEEYNVEEINDTIQQTLSEYLRTTTKTNFGTGLYTTEDKIPAQWQEQSKLVLLYLYNQTNTGTIIGQDRITMQVMAPVEVNFLEGNPYSEAFFKKPFFFDDLGLIPVGFEGEPESERGELKVYYKKGYVEVRGRVLNADGCLVPPRTYNLRRCNRENALNLEEEQFGAGNKTRYFPKNRDYGMSNQTPYYDVIIKKNNFNGLRVKLHYVPTKEWVTVDTNAHVVICKPMTIDDGSFLECESFQIESMNDSRNSYTNANFNLDKYTFTCFRQRVFDIARGVSSNEPVLVGLWYPVRFKDRFNGFVPPLRFAGSFFNGHYLAKRHNLPYSRFAYPEMDQFIKRREFFYDNSLFYTRGTLSSQNIMTTAVEWSNTTPFIPSRLYRTWSGYLNENIDIQTNEEREKYAGFFKAKNISIFPENEGHRFVSPSTTFNSVIEMNAFANGRAKPSLLAQNNSTRYPVLFSDLKEGSYLVTERFNVKTVKPDENGHRFINITLNDADIESDTFYPFNSSMKSIVVLHARMHICDYDITESLIPWSRYSGMKSGEGGIYNLDLIFPDLTIFDTYGKIDDLFPSVGGYKSSKIHDDWFVDFTLNGYSSDMSQIRIYEGNARKPIELFKTDYPYYAISEKHNKLSEKMMEEDIYLYDRYRFRANLSNFVYTGLSNSISGVPCFKLRAAFDNNVYRLNYYEITASDVTGSRGRPTIPDIELMKLTPDVKRGFLGNTYQENLNFIFTGDEKTTTITKDVLKQPFQFYYQDSVYYSFVRADRVSNSRQIGILFDKRGFFVKNGQNLFDIRTERIDAFHPPIFFTLNPASVSGSSLIDFAKVQALDTAIVYPQPQQMVAIPTSYRSTELLKPSVFLGPIATVPTTKVDTATAEQFSKKFFVTPNRYYDTVKRDELNIDNYIEAVSLQENLFGDSLGQSFQNKDLRVILSMVGWRHSVFTNLVDFTGLRSLSRDTFSFIDAAVADKIWVSKFGGLQSGSALIYDGLPLKGEEICFKAVKHFLQLYYPELKDQYTVESVTGPLGTGIFPYPIGDYWQCKKSLQQFTREHVLKTA